MKPALEIKRLTPTAILPTRGSEKAIGLDLYLDAASIVLHPGKRVLASTGIAVGIPPEHYGRIAPRSGLSFKDGIDVMAGVIDEDYTGELKVLLINTDYKTHVYKRGDRIAQFILERASIPDVIEVDELGVTNRGAGGFGSTGT